MTRRTTEMGGSGLVSYLWHVTRPAEGGLLTYLHGVLEAEVDRVLTPVTIGPVPLGIDGVIGLECRMADGVVPASDLRAIRGLQKAARVLPPSVIHCHGAKAALLVRLAFPLGPPVVYSVHRPPGSRLHDAGERYLAWRVGAFLVPSGALRDEVTRRWSVRPDRVVLAPAGISSRWRDSLLEVRRRAANYRVHVGVLSRLMVDKGVDVLLRACARLAAAGASGTGSSKLPLVTVAGDGPERRRLQGMASTLGIAGWVRFVGTVPRGEVRRFLTGSDIFVAPSRREAFGLAAVEALAAGCVSVISSSAGVVEFLRPGRECLVFSSGDDGDLARTLMLALAHPGLRERLSAGGRLAARRLPSIEDHARVLDLVYRGVTAVAADA